MDRSSKAPHSQGDSTIALTITTISGDLEAGTAIGWSPPPDGTAEGSHTLSATTAGEIISSNSSCATLPADIDFFLQVAIGSELASWAALKKLSALHRLTDRLFLYRMELSAGLWRRRARLR